MWVHLLFLWSKEVTAHSVLNMYNFCCEVGKQYFEVHLQINRCCLSHKIKYHHDYASEIEMWAFGLIDTTF
jgi:hypothetical protein